jgi:2'-5' RNA ligase
MPDTTRTFVAVAVPSTLGPRLTRLQEQLAAEAPEGRWAVPSPFHITLAFLGDVGHSDLNAVCLAVAGAASAQEPFELGLEGVGAFPNPARPRAVWAGVVGTGLEALNDLQAAVAGAVARLDYPTDPRPFHAHVTLGRFGPGRRPVRDLTAVLGRYRAWRAGPFAVAEAVAFGSTLTRDGPVYAPLARAPLRHQKPDTSP